MLMVMLKCRQNLVDENLSHPLNLENDIFTEDHPIFVASFFAPLVRRHLLMTPYLECFEINQV